MFSDTPGSPGRSAQIPRTMRSTCTPAHDALAMLALYGQPRERIERYTEEIAAVGPAAFAAARAVFPQGRDYAMVVIGDGEKIASTLSKYGPVTRMRITDPAFSPPPADGNRPTR